MTQASEQVSAQAWFARQMIRALPEEDKVMLWRLFGHQLASPRAGVLRQARLGLLTRLARRGFDGSEDDYNAERDAAAAQGEEWPVGSTLIKAYGSWGTALSCAQRLAAQGSGSRVPQNMHHARGSRPRTKPINCVDALIMMRRRFKHWPCSRWEYLRWKELAIRAALLSDKRKVPNLPGLKQFRNSGGFDTLLAEAQRVFEEMGGR